jgi:type II secretory pathway pseudopilin PulG
MAALLVGLGVMSIMLAAAFPVWTTVASREREAELLFRGEQYTRAIRLYQRRHAGTLPRSVDALLEGRFLRRRYLDPITGGEFRLLFAGAPRSSPESGWLVVQDQSEGYGGIVGVVSSSAQSSLGRYRGRHRYNEWRFVVASAGTPIAALSRVR